MAKVREDAKFIVRFSVPEDGTTFFPIGNKSPISAEMVQALFREATNGKRWNVPSLDECEKEARELRILRGLGDPPPMNSVLGKAETRVLTE